MPDFDQLSDDSLGTIAKLVATWIETTPSFCQTFEQRRSPTT